MGNPIEIHEYNKKNLLKIFHEKSEAAEELILQKNHSEYFDNYLINKDIEVKTIVVENDYIDRDFLEDFSAYYVRCFTDYKRKCTRLHFFSHEFRKDQFESFLESFDEKFKKNLDDNYLGFIVIKPLPQTIIGRTCLKTYQVKAESGDKRVYPIVRNYEVNLCGVSLMVKSLAFQEQDTVVSACATSALWSAFQGTGILFHHKWLSPVEITKAATKQFPLKERPFPNKGLNIEQMMHAVQELDMEPFHIDIINQDDIKSQDDIINQEYILKNYIYSYLTYGIPIILGIALYDTMDKDEKKLIGHHAVVVTGYRLKKESKSCLPADELLLVASNMSRIYVHDDQIGPFAKMIIDGNKIEVKNGEGKFIETISLSTEWKYGNTPKGFIRAVPTIILIPLYHKIRIPFENIREIIEIFNSIIGISIENKIIQIERFEWDIFLTSVNKFKGEILQLSVDKRNFKNILQKDMPRFLWRAKALCEGKPVMDLLFDATDIEQGHLLVCGVVYNKELFSEIQTIIKRAEEISNVLKTHPAGKSLIDWIEKWSMSIEN